MGGGLAVAPGARLDDGRVDVIVVGAVGRVPLLTRLMPGLRDGSYLAHPMVSHHTARHICVETTDQVVLTIDGELAGRAPTDDYPAATRTADCHSATMTNGAAISI